MDKNQWTHKIPKPIDPSVSTSTYSSQEAWRVFGIMAEFVAATERLNTIRPAVSIFGSSRTDTTHPYYKQTEEIARLLSDAGFSVISGGGPGIMEAANKGAFFGRSPAVGLNIRLPNEQYANVYQDISVNFRYFFSRKVMFVRFASAYVVMPGGYGTLDELTEALTLVQTAKTRKIPIILVGSRFWRGLLDWMQEKLVGENMISPEDMELMQIIDDSPAVVEAIFKHYERRGFQPTRAEREIMLNL